VYNMSHKLNVRTQSVSPCAACSEKLTYLIVCLNEETNIFGVASSLDSDVVVTSLLETNYIIFVHIRLEPSRKVASSIPGDVIGFFN
jgi:hypothetical protein